MSVVRIEPLGDEICLHPGDSVAEAAWRLGYHWPTTWYGQASCMQCRVRIVAGEEFVVPADDEESEAMQTRLTASARKPGIRLGCRLTVVANGLVTVEKRGVRPPGAPDGVLVRAYRQRPIEGGRQMAARQGSATRTPFSHR